MEILDVVNDKNEVIDALSYAEVYAKKLNHRIVHVFLFNPAGKMLLQQRSAKKAFMPLHLVTSAGGHVQSGETYEAAALREMKEETGLTCALVPVFDDIYEYSPGSKKFLRTYRGECNDNQCSDSFTINEEVEKIEWFTLSEIEKMIAQGEKFHPELLFLLKKHYFSKH